MVEGMMYGTYYVMCWCIGYGMGYCTGDGGGVWYIFGVLYRPWVWYRLWGMVYMYMIWYVVGYGYGTSMGLGMVYDMVLGLI